jgi:signal peptide peptidase SppA
MTRLEEITQRIGARPALIRMQDVSDLFGEAAPYHIEGGIAMIDVCGVLTNAAWSWGGTTYGELQDQINIASVDPNVTGILLVINSPGGECDNAFETATVVANAAKLKPVYAVAGTMAASAAYLLASQADKIYLPNTSGGVGSIGIVCTHMDVSKAMQMAGLKATQISAGTGKTAGSPYQPLSDADRETMQAEVDRLYGEFVGAVAKGRGIAPQAIVTMGARMFYGAANAIQSGLADATGDASTAWADLCAEAQKPKTPVISGFKLAASANSTEGKMETVKTETTATAYLAGVAAPVIDVAAITAAAEAKGFNAAQEIVDLCAIAGKPAEAAGFIAARKSVAEVRTALMAARVADDKTSAELNASVLLGQKAKEATAEGTPKPWGEVMGELAGRAFGLKGSK